MAPGAASDPRATLREGAVPSCLQSRSERRIHQPTPCESRTRKGPRRSRRVHEGSGRPARPPDLQRVNLGGVHAASEGHHGRPAPSCAQCNNNQDMRCARPQEAAANREEGLGRARLKVRGGAGRPGRRPAAAGSSRGSHSHQPAAVGTCAYLLKFRRWRWGRVVKPLVRTLRTSVVTRV